MFRGLEWNILSAVPESRETAVVTVFISGKAFPHLAYGGFLKSNFTLANNPSCAAIKQLQALFIPFKRQCFTMQQCANVIPAGDSSYLIKTFTTQFCIYQPGATMEQHGEYSAIMDSIDLKGIKGHSLHPCHANTTTLAVTTHSPTLPAGLRGWTRTEGEEH